MSMLVPSQPVQGALYHRLNTLVAANYAGLGPQNVSTLSYRPMTGKSFQKPLSGSTTGTTTVPNHKYR